MSSYVSSFYAAFDLAQAEAELAEAIRSATQHEAERNEADRKARSARADIQAIEQVIAGYRAYSTAHRGVEIHERNGRVDSQKKNTRADVLTGRASILALIESGRDDEEWTIKKIGAALGASEEQFKAIGTSLQRLVTGFNGTPPQLARPRKGVYTKLLPVPEATEAGEEQRVTLNGGSQQGAGQAAPTFRFG